MLRLKVIDAADVPSVLAVQSRCYEAVFHESAEAFEAKLTATRGLHCSYLAVDGDQALGYVVSLPVDDGGLPALNARDITRAQRPRTLYLHDVAVVPEGRARRLGQLLVQQVVQRAQDMGMRQLALVAVQASQDYWQRQSFTAADPSSLSAAVHEKLASFGPGACLMRRPLVPA